MTESIKSGADQVGNDAADKELAAIQALLSALTSLDSDGRDRVVGYVFQRLGLSLQRAAADSAGDAPRVPSVGVSAAREAAATGTPKDIRSLKESKQPRSSIEMAVLVAYYLSEIAPPGARKTSIGTEELTTYFKQAGFPLPATPRQTLFNAKAAGYLDSSAQGSYTLNPVGHNLVAHTLPAVGGDGSSRGAKRGSAKKGAKKKAAKPAKKK